MNLKEIVNLLFYMITTFIIFIGILSISIYFSNKSLYYIIGIPYLVLCIFHCNFVSKNLRKHYKPIEEYQELFNEYSKLLEKQR